MLALACPATPARPFRRRRCMDQSVVLCRCGALELEDLDTHYLGELLWLSSLLSIRWKAPTLTSLSQGRDASTTSLTFRGDGAPSACYCACNLFFVEPVDEVLLSVISNFLFTRYISSRRNCWKAYQRTRGVVCHRSRYSPLESLIYSFPSIVMLAFYPFYPTSMN
jgi:hypothetical protein